MRTYLLGAIMALGLMVLAAVGSKADVIINSYGASPFLYDGYSYVPLRSTCDYLGANLLWDAPSQGVTITYRDRNLALSVGATRGYYGGNAIALPVPVIYAHNQLFAPALIFNRYLDVPTRWESRDRRVFFQSNRDWGYYTVDPYPPTYILPFFTGYGAPGYYGGVSPFYYGGDTYVPLRTFLTFLGVALLFDRNDDSCDFDYGGHRYSLLVGSRDAFIGDRRIRLSHEPIYVHNNLYVSESFFSDHLKVPIERDHNILRLRNQDRTREFDIRSSPPGRISRPHIKAQALSRAYSRHNMAVPSDISRQASREQRQQNTRSARQMRSHHTSYGSYYQGMRQHNNNQGNMMGNQNMMQGYGRNNQGQRGSMMGGDHGNGMMGGDHSGNRGQKHENSGNNSGHNGGRGRH